MSPKSLVLVAGAVAILAVGVYLFLEVRAVPAQASPDHTVAARTPTPPPQHDMQSDPGAMKSPDVKMSVPVPSTPTQTQSPTRLTQETPPVPPPDETRVDMKLDNMMELANKAYDRQDFDEAQAIAGKILSKDPTNVRMLRVMVSANCISGDSGVAQTYYEKLPKFDRDQMKQRCDRYGVVFKDPPN